MIHLITGGSASGKSAYAEDWLLEAADEAQKGAYIYVATMIPYGRETMAKILRHRRLREGKGFVTMECPRNLAGAAIPGESCWSASPILRQTNSMDSMEG